MSYTGHTAVNATKGVLSGLFKYIFMPIVVVVVVVSGWYGYMRYITSCDYLSHFSNADMEAMLWRRDDRIFALTQSMRFCPAKQYTPYLVKALGFDMAGHIGPFNVESLAGDANRALNKIYGRDLYFHEHGDGTEGDLLKRSDETINTWNSLYSKGELR